MAKLVEDDMSLANKSLESLKPVIDSILNLKQAMTEFRVNSPGYLSGTDFDALFKKYEEKEGQLGNLANDINTIISNAALANQTMQAYIDRKPAALAACEITEIDNSKLGELQVRLDDAEYKLEIAEANMGYYDSQMTEYKNKMDEISSTLGDSSITDPNYRASLSVQYQSASDSYKKYCGLYQSAKEDYEYYSEKIELLKEAIAYLSDLQPTDETAYSQITSSQTTFTWF